MVVQADPKTRQYKVMTFGSRRLTLRNRRFLRKYTPVHTPPGTPTGMKLGMRLGGQMLPATLVPVQPQQMTSTPAGMPVSTRVSARTTKGQTTRYDDYVQQINLRPGTYVTDGIRLFKLEDTSNMSSMVYANQQQNPQLAWPPATACVQQLNGEKNYLYTDMATQH